MKDMKKIFVAILGIAALLLAGCAKNESAPVQESRVVRVTAGADDLLTKVASSTKGRFTWQTNDAIGVWTGAGITKFTLDPNWAGFGHGEFVGELPEGGKIDETSYAVYPYEEGATATATSYTFPTFDKYAIPAATYMLYAKGDGTVEDGTVANFTFHHTTAYFRVTVKNIQGNVGALFLESAGPCFAKGVTVDFSGETPTFEYEKDDFMFYATPEHNGAIESTTLIIPVAPDAYAQQWGKGGLKFRIVCFGGPDLGTPQYDSYAGFLGEETGIAVSVGEYYIFPDITCENLKQPDDSGTGVNDGIEDSTVNIQNPDDFWTVSLN